MKDLAKRLLNWCGRKLYGSDWPPLVILVLRQKTPFDEITEPKWKH